jgi:branched-chain amino acid transport system ATP-binding protein
VLELREVRVGYGQVEVIHGVELSVAEGEVVGLIGPNGAGKTTLLRGICGVRRPSGGEVRLGGELLNGLTPEVIAERGISLVPEGRRIFTTLTVAENLRLAARSEDRVAAIKERFPILAERAGQRAGHLSGGEKQQLTLARALLREPRLLILDEPSLGLAPKMIDLVYDVLERLRDAGTTMLVVEQNAARTIEFCDRCLVLAGGAVRAEGTRTELQRHPELLRAYLGRQP